MTTEDNIFAGTDQVPVFDPNKNYLPELVGDDKKFKTQEDLAKGKFQSDLYIKHLEKRLDEVTSDYTKMHDEYKATKRLDEVLDQITKLPPTGTSSNPPQANEPPQSVFDPKQIENLVQAEIQKTKSIEKQTENYNLVKNKLQEHYGDNYAAALKQHTQSLGLSEDFVNTLAKNHPQVLFKTLGLDNQQQEGFQTPPRSNQRMDNFAPNTLKRDYPYYQKMRREQPKTYNDPKTRVQMHNDAIAQGEAFFAGAPPL